MIWKRIKKSSGEQEEKFKEMMTEEKVSFKEKLAMVLSGYLVILLQCLLILALFGLLMLWIFGAL